MLCAGANRLRRIRFSNNLLVDVDSGNNNNHCIVENDVIELPPSAHTVFNLKRSADIHVENRRASHCTHAVILVINLSIDTN